MPFNRNYTSPISEDLDELDIELIEEDDDADLFPNGRDTDSEDEDFI